MSTNTDTLAEPGEGGEPDFSGPHCLVGLRYWVYCCAVACMAAFMSLSVQGIA